MFLWIGQFRAPCIAITRNSVKHCADLAPFPCRLAHHSGFSGPFVTDDSRGLLTMGSDTGCWLVQVDWLTGKQACLWGAAGTVAGFAGMFSPTSAAGYLTAKQLDGPNEASLLTLDLGVGPVDEGQPAPAVSVLHNASLPAGVSPWGLSYVL